MTILVTGATGNTGGLVVARLRDRGHPVRVTSRKPSGDDVRFDWTDGATHDAVLAGVSAMYLVAPVGDPDPVAVMLAFLARAREAGVRRAVLLGSSAIQPGDAGPGLVARRLAEMYDEWAVLRPSWFMSNFVGEHTHAASIRERGEIVSATGDGRVAFVDPADIADVAVHALTDATSHNTDHIITGPEALSYDDVAAALGARHRRVCVAELAQWHVAHGVPQAFAILLAGLDANIAAGAEDRVTPTVALVTGREPASLYDFLARKRDAPHTSSSSSAHPVGRGRVLVRDPAVAGPTTAPDKSSPM